MRRAISSVIPLAAARVRASLVAGLCLLSACALSEKGSATEEGELKDFREVVAGLESFAGLYRTWLDRERGQLWLEIPRELAPEHGLAPSGYLSSCLYVEGLASGLGSNDIGLDRGQIGATRQIVFRRFGGKVLIQAPNLEYRSSRAGSASDLAGERAAQESFATSVLWAGTVEAEIPEGGVLINMTSFLVRDAHDSLAALTQSGGSWSFDAERSVLEPAGCLSFPANLEFEALLTFRGQGAGRDVREVAPDANSVTLVQHHSFIALPDTNYAVRPWDPRTGAISQDFIDVGAHPARPNKIRYAVRHRLEKRDPAAALSDPVEPLVYYVDRGAPEPVRTALVEGASWWNEAFEAAGFRDAFRVELLPEGVHPLDARYNVIQWVHRSSRGWSYGGGIRDPRTGEMIKGHVTLGSLRVRQDRLLFDGLVGASSAAAGTREANGVNDALAASGDSEATSTDLALARIRQLAAHEVGHTLGLAHNFAASTCGRASVMDYPAPLVRTRGPKTAGAQPYGSRARLDLSEAYASGVGAWDLFAVRDLYADLPANQDLGEWREQCLESARRADLVYLTDEDARSAGAADPRGSLWDNGADPVSALREVIEARAVALADFDARRVLRGESTVEYEEVLVPLYFMHRYQVEALAKTVGGRKYQHALVGDGTPSPSVISGEEQRRALDALLFSLFDTLEVPDAAQKLLAPSTVIKPRWREAFAGRSAPEFDELGLAEAATRLVLEPLFVPERLARVVEQRRGDSTQLGLDELLARVIEVSLAQTTRLDDELQSVLAEVVVEQFVSLASSPDASVRVRAQAVASLRILAKSWDGLAARLDPTRALLRHRIESFLARDWDPFVPEAAPRKLPPGSPIGCSAG